MDSVPTLYSKPGVLKKSPWHNYLDPTLVPPSSLAWGKCSKCGNCPGQAEQNQAGSITWERERERESKDKEVWGGPLTPWPLSSSPQLSPSQHLRDQAAWHSCQNPEVCLQQQSKVCTGKGNPVLPPLPSLGWRNQGLCCSLGVCALAAHPSPSPTSIPAPTSSQETTAKLFPCLTPSSWHPLCPAIEWGSKPPPRVLLTLVGGKSTMSLFLPLHFQL